VIGSPDSQALSRYHALYESYLARNAKPEMHKGLDRIASRAIMRAKERKANLRWLTAQAKLADALAPEIKNHSEAALDDAVLRIREVFVRGRQDDQTVRRATALVREVARRETGEEAYVVQLVGALALYHGRVIEMLTGEGKTLTGSIAAPLIAWQRRHLHVFTVTDYLAARDAHSRACIYNRCGVSVGAIQQEQPPAERFPIYARNIVYGTPKQITADFLRDQIRIGKASSAWAWRQQLAMMGQDAVQSGAGPMVPGLRAALVDEADAVLIDEGVVPLIIARSRREDEMADIYMQAGVIADKLDEGPDFSLDRLKRQADLKRRGKHRCEQMFEQLSDPIWSATRRAEELVRQALVARYCYIKGQHYEIVDGQVVIVDEYTGRFLPDRNWEHGLHQSVEAKEGVEINADRETLARLSFQRFFRSYAFLSGMTGTIADSKGELESVYSRPVTVVPTNRPVIREQWPTRVFRKEESKWDAVVESISAIHAEGRPMLIGTRSIAASELLSSRLEARGLTHRVLNANFDDEEAQLIAEAGRAGVITVATNMAGRGTDIKPDQESLDAGGLHVMLTEMHTAQRIDRQFIGRSGRQGDPGSAQIFVSLEDELITHHAPEIGAILKRIAASEELRSTRAVRALLREAQHRAERRARRNRAGVLRQDDWIDKNLPGG